MRAISRDKEQKGEEKPLYSLVSGNNRVFFSPRVLLKGQDKPSIPYCT